MVSIEVSEPFEKFQALLIELRWRGGNDIKHQRGFAKAALVHKSVISTHFGERLTGDTKVRPASSDVPLDLLEKIAQAATRNGVRLEPSDFERKLQGFKLHLVSSRDENQTGWGSGGTTYSIERLVELTLHTPKPGNEPGTLIVDATLLIGVRETSDPDDPERPVLIGLREAFLQIEALGCQTTKNSVVGDDGREHVNVDRSPGGIKIIGPRGQNGWLKGSPLPEGYLATIEPTSNGDGEVRLILTAPYFHVWVGPPTSGSGAASEPSQSPNKAAILNLIIGEGLQRKSAAGRL